MRVPRKRAERLKDNKAHPYPFEIALQTLEFIQATHYYLILQDIAAGEYFKNPDGFNNIQNMISMNGVEMETQDEALKYIELYKPIFSQWVFQNALILVRSHWDWYIRHLGGFVMFARQHTKTMPKLTSKESEKLEKIGFKEIIQQLKILEECTNIKFNIDEASLRSLQEMTYVRNLGIHNRWEVDKKYKNNPKVSTTLEIGDIRTFDINELVEWERSLNVAISETRTEIAKKFQSVPDFNPEVLD